MIRRRASISTRKSEEDKGHQDNSNYLIHLNSILSSLFDGVYCCSSTKDFLKEICFADCLDKSCVMPPTKMTSAVSVDLNEKSCTENANVDGDVVNSLVLDNLKPAVVSNIRFKFKVDHSSQIKNEDFSEPGNRSLSETEVIEVKKDELPNKTEENPENERKKFPSKLNFKFKLSQPSFEEESNLVDERNESLILRVPKKIRRTEFAGEESIGREKFGTRGLKLSSVFLQNATDYIDDFIEDDNFDVSNTLIENKDKAPQQISALINSCEQNKLI